MTNEKKHMSAVAELPCAVCGAYPVEVHHVMKDRVPGRRSSDFLVIPVCPSCHRDNHNGIHGDKRMWDIHKMTEPQALANTIERLFYK
jgi:hypothetical protein